LKKHIALLLLTTTILIACSEDKTDKPKPSHQMSDDTDAIAVKPETNVLMITNQLGQPIANAKVLIGSALNVPFQNNFLTADQNGQLAIPAGWVDAQSVTVQAPGFVRLTYLNQMPGAIKLKLNPVLQAPTKLQVSGVTTGHPVKDSDGFIDFSLVMSAMTRQDVLAFDLSKVISTQFDQISVIGQSLDIPTNISLPKQREFYGIFPINLNKPNYKLLFSNAGDKKIYGARARFPFRQVVDELRAKKKFYELINSFELSGGAVKQVKLSNKPLVLNIPINELNFVNKKNLKAPAIRADEVVIAMALADLSGEMIPTDIKKLESNKIQPLALHPTAPSLVATVLKRAADFEGAEADTLSAVIMPFTANLSPQSLPLIEKPRLSRVGLSLVRPRKTNEVNELATLAQMSEILEIPVNDEIKLPFLVRKWEVFSPQWAESLVLPEWPSGTPRAEKMRWETTYIGSQLKNERELGQAVIDAATHFTHSSIDF
jgi:hypothetical protein